MDLGKNEKILFSEKGKWTSINLISNKLKKGHDFLIKNGYQSNFIFYFSGSGDW